MNQPQTDDSLALLDELKAQAERLEQAASEMLDAVRDAEGALLADDVDPDADRCDLIGSELGTIAAVAMDAEGAALQVRDLLGD